MEFNTAGRRWGTVVFWVGVAVFGLILVPWRTVVGWLGWPAPGSTQAPIGTPTPPAPEGAVEVYLVSANTKQNWISVVTDNFNQAGFKTSLGHPIFVRVDHDTSGGSQGKILAGLAQPQAWSPGDQSWVDVANQVWIDRYGRPLIPDACRATGLSPIGFAMWRPMAEAMGWPGDPIGWDEIVALAAAPEGWGLYGRPEWGQFKFGHTHPAHSNSGLLMLTALVYDTLNLTDPLTPQQVFDPAVLDALRNVELHTYHYGEQSRNLINLMVEHGQSYLHAINTTEAETIKTNVERGSELDRPLAFIVPAQGTYWTEQPYCILDADWVSPEQKEAAGIYGDYLRQPEQQQLTVENYMRPIDAARSLACPLCLEQGTDPSRTPQNMPTLASPSADVAEAVKDAFLQTKRKATIVLALDVSDSMNQDHKLTSALSATIGFLGQLHPDDVVVVVKFNSQVTALEPSGRAGDVSEGLMQTVSGLFAGTSTALYDAICKSVELANALKLEDEAKGDPRLYGVVVLSDGVDWASQMSETQMFATCLPTGEAVQGIRVYTIAYGADANLDLLKRIANRTNGKWFEGDPATIEEVYEEISAEQ
jgi:Ca-activated chloride channel homolog